jgi:O-antigen ligase
MVGDATGTDFRSRFLAFDWRSADFRRIAEPIAVVSPLALIVSAQEPVMILVALLFMAHSWRARDWAWLRSGWFIPLLALWAYAFLRTLLVDPTATGVLTALQWIHFPVYCAALATWLLPKKETRERLLWALIATITFYSLDCLLQFAIGHDIIGRPKEPHRLTSVFHKPGVGAEIGWLFLPAIAGLWSKGRSFWALGLGVIAFAAVLLSGDRMALLLSLAAIVLFGAFAARAHKALLLVLPAIAVVLAGLLYFSPEIYHRQVETTETIIGRVGESVYGIIWKSAIDIAHDYPALGVGVRNYQAVCTQERYGPLLIGPDEFKRCQGHPHNIYLQWLAETGAIGLALYCAFAALALAAIVRAAPTHRDDLLFVALAVATAERLWPLATMTSFYSSWSTAAFFLMLGWALSYRPREIGDAG